MERARGSVQLARLRPSAPVECFACLVDRRHRDSQSRTLWSPVTRIGLIRRGSLVQSTTVCGEPGCRCQAFLPDGRTRSSRRLQPVDVLGLDVSDPRERLLESLA
ncbi:MAG: DUF6788 family protein [Actinomycetota bacterium]